MTATEIYESLDEFADNLLRIEREQILITIITILATLGFMWLFIHNQLEWNYWEVSVVCPLALVVLSATSYILWRVSKNNHADSKKKLKDKLGQLLETQRALGFVNEDIRMMCEMLKEEEEQAAKKESV